jgi:plastocyanin
MRQIFALTVAFSLSTLPLAAQTTHEVSLFGQAFLPDDITIQVGDTVRWNWVAGYHDVVSGVGGVPDGHFGSQLTVGPFTFEVTFDQAFLDANPAPGGVYDYYCTVHLPGMVGRVVVQGSASGQFQAYGSGVNAPTSLFPGGSPNTGGTAVFTLLNPVAAPAGPGFGALFLATSPDPGYPGGTLIPGWGLGQGSPGELLVSIVPPDPVLSLGFATWEQNATVVFDLPIPADPNLVGVSLFVQGALIDLTKPEPIGLTAAVEMVIG